MTMSYAEPDKDISVLKPACRIFTKRTRAASLTHNWLLYAFTAFKPENYSSIGRLQRFYPIIQLRARALARVGLREDFPALPAGFMEMCNNQIANRYKPTCKHTHTWCVREFRTHTHTHGQSRRTHIGCFFLSRMVVGRVATYIRFIITMNANIT